MSMDYGLQDELSSSVSSGEAGECNKVDIFGKVVDNGKYGVFTFRSG